MAGITLPVRPRCWDDSPTLTSRAIQGEPSNIISWAPYASSRPKRLRQTECRRLFTPNSKDIASLPAIHVHGSKCRCTPTQTEDQLQDDLLAQRISSLTESLLSTRCLRSTPSPTTTTPTIAKSQPRHCRSSSSSSPIRVLTTLTRFFSPPSPQPHSLQLQADLCIGCADLDLDKVARYLLPEDANTPPLPVNTPNHLGITPLMAAVRSPAAKYRPKTQLAMVRFLVDCCGADVDAVKIDRVTGQGESVLSMACAGGAEEMVRFLVGRGADAGRRLPCGSGLGGASRRGIFVGRGQTALHVSVLAERGECVDVLLREGKADVNAVFDASGVGEPEGGRKGLRRKGKSVSREGREKQLRHPVSALHLAHGSHLCTEVLLKCGADVGLKDGYGRTPLHWAAEAGSVDVVRLLVGAGADVNAAANDGRTPLGSVVTAMEEGKTRSGYVEVVNVLLRNGADSAVKGPDRGTLKEWLLAMEESLDVF
ncbi:hypothetical protein VTI74DRAFT_7769 [Chaetomium olivicolor]